MRRMNKASTSSSDDRRAPTHPADDEFTPEYLAVLVVCGGTVRESDWALLPEALAARRPAANSPSVEDNPSA